MEAMYKAVFYFIERDLQPGEKNNIGRDGAYNSRWITFDRTGNVVVFKLEEKDPTENIIYCPKIGPNTYRITGDNGYRYDGENIILHKKNGHPAINYAGWPAQKYP